MQQLFKIVLLDNNLVIRSVLKSFLSFVRKKSISKLQVYTSEDGVQGLGYIFITQPNLIVIDTTLPKYSGRELIQFLESNQKLKSSDVKVLVLHDGTKDLDLPDNFKILDKRKINFLSELKNILIGEKPVQFTSRWEKLKWFLLGIGELAIYFANWSDIFYDKYASSFILLKPVWGVLWILTQILTSIFFTFNKLIFSEISDDNISQSAEDKLNYRVRYYPTLITFFGAAIVILIQFTLFILGGFLIFEGDSSAATGYNYRRQITINNSQVSGSTNHTDFPMLFSGTYSYLATTGNGGKVENSNGYDIIFTSDSTGTILLDHEIEEYNPLTGEVAIWVKIPTLQTSADTNIYMFYGNNTISASQEDVAGVWSNNFAMVQHLEESSTTSDAFQDSTTNSNDSAFVQVDGTGANPNADGISNGGVQFDGNNDNIAISDSASLSQTGDMTIEAWVNLDALPSVRGEGGVIATKLHSVSPFSSYFLDVGTSDDIRFGWKESGGGGANSVYSGTLTTGNWYYVTGVRSGTSIQLYVNGSTASTTSPTLSGSGLDSDGQLRIGAAGSTSARIDGFIDEVKVSSTARDADWINTKYSNVNNPAGFYTVGSETILGSGGPPAGGSGESYYFDNTNGNDANPGTEAQPKKSINEFNVLDLDPGDTVYFKRGETWNGGLKLRNEDAGSATDPITITAYGTGNKPIITNDTQPTGGRYMGLDIFESPGYIVVDNLEFENINFAGVQILSTQFDITIQNCEFDRTGFGINIKSSNVYVSNNYIHDLTMIVNTPTSENPVDDYGAIGVNIQGGSAGISNIHVNDNIFENLDQFSYDYGTDGGPFSLFETMDGVYIYNNYSENTKGFIEAGGSDGDDILQNVYMYNNITYQYFGISWLFLNAPSGNDPYDASYFNFIADHNTIYSTASDTRSITFFAGEAPNANVLKFRNNIAVFSQVADISDYDDFEHDYNIFYRADGGSINTSTQPKAYVPNTNEIIGQDPLLVDPANGDFSLQSGSPARNAGADLDYSTDYNGDVRFQGSAPDMGAIEYDEGGGSSSGSTGGSGTDYFFDNTNGNDSNPGTEAQPKKSLNEFNVLDLEPGDNVYFKRGETWNGLMKFRSEDEGTANDRITITAYGTGNRPQFSNTTQTSAGKYMVGDVFQAPGYITFDNLHITNAQFAGIQILSTQHEIIIQNCEIDNVGLGVNIKSSNVVADNNYVHDLTMVTNTVGGEDDYGAIAFNIVGGTVGISNITVSNNTVERHIDDSFDYTKDGGFVELFENLNNIYVHGNIAQDGKGFVESGGSTGSDVLQNVFIYNNISYDNVGGPFLFFNAPGGGPYDAVYNNFVAEHNTIWHTQPGGSGALNTKSPIWFSGEEPDPSVLIFRNNIVGITVTDVADYDDYTHTHNLFYKIDGGSINHSSTDPKGHVLDTGEITGQDPLITDAANGDFSLESGSPAINVGADLGYATDYEGESRSQGAAPEIGAIEFTEQSGQTGGGTLSGYDYRKTITIDSSLVSGSTNLTDFPLLVNLSSDSDLQSNALSNADDIVFTSDDGETILDYEIESYNSSNGSLQAWIRIPSLSYNADTDIFMYYGNSGATNQENAAGVWANFDSVWHLPEDPTGGAPQFNDSSSSNDGTAVGSILAGAQITGQIDGSIDFDGTDDRIEHNYSLNRAQGTIMHWLKPDQVRDMVAYYEADGTNSGRNGFGDASDVLEIHTAIDDGTWEFMYQLGAGTATAVNTGSPSTTDWTHVVATWNQSGNMEIFIDGVSGGTANMSGTTWDSDNVTSVRQLGRVGAGNSTRHWDGGMDHVKTSSSVFTSDWILTEFRNQDSPGTFYNIGGQQDLTGPTFTVGTIGTQVSNVNAETTDIYVGGAFSILPDTGTESVTGITISETGSVDAQNGLDNIKLFYETDISSPYNCSSSSYGGTETQFGATDTDGFSGSNGTASFTDSVQLDSTTALCVYVVLDTTTSVSDSQTIEIEISDPSSDITVSSGGASPATNVQISGTTNINVAGCAVFGNGYCYRRDITVDNTKVAGSSDLTNFPILVQGTYSYLATESNGGDVTNSNGYDIIFTSDEAGNTTLDHEIESYNENTGEVSMWVEIPTLSYNSDTTIYMFYGNSSISTSQEDVTGTWDTNFEMVHHLEETTSASGDIQDSTSNNIDNAYFNSAGGTGHNLAATGAANGAIQLDGNDDFIGFSDNALLSPSGDMTFEAWVNFDTLPSTRAEAGVLGVKQHSATPFSSYFLEVNTSDLVRFNWANSGGTNVIATNNTSFSTGTWYHLAGVRTGDTITIYVNGDDTNTSTFTLSGTALDSDGELRLGASFGGGGRIDGIIEEYRLSDVARSGDWLTTTYNTIIDPSTFYNVGSQQGANSAPILTGLLLNGGNNISLIENTSTTVNFEMSVTDQDDPFTDITDVEAVLYRSGISGGKDCTPDDANCYVQTTYYQDNCSSTTCTMVISFNVEFFADPTSSGTPFANEWWLAYIEVTDSAGNTDFEWSASDVTDVESLIAADIDNSINYGTVFSNSDTGGINQSIDLTNTGNIELDLELYGDDLCTDYPTCSGSTIDVSNQEYSTISFTYGAGISMTSSLSFIDLNFDKATATPSNAVDTLYWGIAAPNGLAPGNYSGINFLLVGQSTN